MDARATRATRATVSTTAAKDASAATNRKNSRLGAHRRVQRRVQLRRADADEHQRQRRRHPSRSTTPHCEVPGLFRARSRPTARAPLQWRQSRVVAVSRLEEKQIVALAVSDLDRWVDAVFAIDSRVPTARFDRRPRSAWKTLAVSRPAPAQSRDPGVDWREPNFRGEFVARASPTARATGGRGTMSAFLASALPVAARASARRPRLRRVARARAVAVPRVGRAEVPAIVSDISLPTTARPSTTPASSLDAAQHHPPSDPTLDLGKVALGSRALLPGRRAPPTPRSRARSPSTSPISPPSRTSSDPRPPRLHRHQPLRRRRRVRRRVPHHSQGGRASREVFSHPGHRPRHRGGCLEKQVELDGIEAVALVANAINQARDHPTVTSGVILAVIAVALSPYILVAALVGLLVSGCSSSRTH